MEPTRREKVIERVLQVVAIVLLILAVSDFYNSMRLRTLVNEQAAEIYRLKEKYEPSSPVRNCAETPV